MELSKKNIQQISPQQGLSIPEQAILALPEKVLQFGTGVLLRGLPDYFIDKANKKGIFNGRVVIVKSTSNGGTDAFTTQDGLFTLCVKGIEESKKVEETIINASISRVLSAAEEWQEVLNCAQNPEMQLVISNTTEVGIVLTQDDIHQSPPTSFPGKLLAFLHERYKVFNGSVESGMVIVPTELITDNGTKLREIVLELAEQNRLEKPFIQWLASANHFCNSLVDRIVPGKLPTAEQKAAEQRLGYTDELMIMAEPFRLWAIESGSERVKEVLSFSQADKGVVVTPDIEKFRELKLRLLNGTHTFSSGLAVLAGFTTVKDAMADENMAAYVRRLMMLEIAAAVSGDTMEDIPAKHKFFMQDMQPGDEMIMYGVLVGKAQTRFGYRQPDEYQRIPNMQLNPMHSGPIIIIGRRRMFQNLPTELSTVIIVLMEGWVRPITGYLCPLFFVRTGTWM
jgi:tagaturonate reductase